ncbi:MAG: acetylornithine deacetylase, partial [Acidiferrobacterales bacterium]|nr:acetylornithine deacetylase [Acidiferrobacterales bacterium]
NLELIRFIEAYLSGYGVCSTLTCNDEGTKANLYARFGPDDGGGVMLSGHTDVVPVDGQDWTVDPFTMSVKDSRLYGRGTTDMKGFIACVLAIVPRAVEKKLSQPIHLAFSYDEEIGCVGVRRMIDMLESAPDRPAFCIVGEPTEMAVGIGHKGKLGATCRCRGVEAHSALANKGLNAIYLASEMIQAIREIQSDLVENGEHDHHYSVPYSTLHVGVIEGGTALNIVPKDCHFKFEIRNTSADDPDRIFQRVKHAARNIEHEYQQDFPDAQIAIEMFNQYPALNTSAEEDVVSTVQKLMDTDSFIKLAFGTEGGLFQNRLGIPTVICGPGSMDQGHKPDEFIARSELERCDTFLNKLLQHICDG